MSAKLHRLFAAECFRCSLRATSAHAGSSLQCATPLASAAAVRCFEGLSNHEEPARFSFDQRQHGARERRPSGGLLGQGSEGVGTQSLGIALPLARQVYDPTGHQQSDAVLLIRQTEISEDRLVSTGHDGYDVRSERAARFLDAAGNRPPSVLKLAHRPNQTLLQSTASGGRQAPSPRRHAGRCGRTASAVVDTNNHYAASVQGLEAAAGRRRAEG
jgi:hypothetical protein